MDIPKNLDDEAAAIIAKAYATFRERTNPANGWIEREPFSTEHRFVHKKASASRAPISVDEAFDMLIRANVSLERAKEPASVEQVWALWDEYKYAYAANSHGLFPAQEIAQQHLSVLMLHDLFNSTKKYVLSKHQASVSPGRRRMSKLVSFGSLGGVLADTLRHAPVMYEPFALLVKKAETMRGWIDSSHMLKKRAFAVLNKNGFDVFGLTENEIRELKNKVHHANSYPRTYL